MEFRRAKIFSKENKVFLLDYDINDDYYAYIKKHSDEGYEQVILTTDFMLAILKHYFINRKFNLKEILPIDDEPFLVEKFQRYLEMLEDDREKIIYFLSELDFLLYEKNALDIFKIELSGKSLSEKRTRFSAQINGIICINVPSYEEEKEELIKVISNHLEWEV